MRFFQNRVFPVILSLYVAICWVRCSEIKLNGKFKNVTSLTATNAWDNERLEKENELKKGIAEKEVRKPVKLTMKQGLTMNQILSIYALTESSNELCKNQSLEFTNGLRAFEPWALKMFDSSSKLQSGILIGNLVEYGNFKQCLEIYHSSEFGPIRGKHCTLRILPDIKLVEKILSFRNVSSQRFKRVYIFVENATLDWSICVPDSCNADTVLHHLGKIIYTLTDGLDINITLNENDCYTVFDEKSLEKTELVVITTFGLYFALIATCTIVDFYSTADEAVNNKMVLIFSAWRNSKQIFSESVGSGNLDCVHGIRFLSTSYVIIGHRYLMMMFFPVINSLQIMEWITYYRSTVITGGTLCVDSFFMISGMLVSIGYFKQIDNAKSISWPMFYIYRFLRITPPLAIVVLWYTTLMQHFGSGPLWNDMLSIIQKPCQEYWWAVILHIQNYVHPFPLCMTQTWYLTCDMQYYFLSPIILIPLSKGPVFGGLVYIVVYCLSVASSFYFAWIHKYSGGVPVTDRLFATQYFQYHYITPHTRASTYILGLGLGYVIHKTRYMTIKMGYPTIILGWISCLILLLSSLVGCIAFHSKDHEYDRLESSVYLSVSRSAWTFGIMWMVWSCIHGYGGPINFVLSHQIFKILGRISYGMYLLHMQMQYMMSAAAKQPGYFSDFNALYASFGDLVIMVVIAFGFTVCFESPLIKLLSIFFLGGAGKKKILPNKSENKSIIKVEEQKKEKLFTVT